MAFSLLILALSSTLLAENATVTFRITPRSMPDTNAVMIVGNIDALGAWDHAGALMLHQGPDSVWEGSIQVPKDSLFAFKVTRGAWSREATTTDGILPPDTWIQVEADTVLIVEVPRWTDERASRRGGVVGDVIHHEGFPSTIMGVGRDIWVLLPRSYHEAPAHRYPVLYVHDGQNAFDPTRSYAGVDWQIDEAVDTLAAQGRLPEILVVAIESSPRRMFEYADTTLGELYARFVTEELKPFIDDAYRTETSRHHTAVMGAGMGGLVSFLMAWWYPDVFGQAACLSPAFVWGDEKTVKQIRTGLAPQPKPRLFMTVGTVGVDSTLAPGVRRICALLEEHGWTEDINLVCRVVKGAGHHERDWSMQLNDALPFLFSGMHDRGGEP